MSQNSSPSLLDGGQVIKRIYEETDDAIRVKVASGTSFAVALDVSDGDTVGVQGNGSSTKASITNANTGVISGNISAPDATVSTFTGFTTTIRAIDQEYNYTDRNFTIYYSPTLPTWTVS